MYVNGEKKALIRKYSIGNALARQDVCSRYEISSYTDRLTEKEAVQPDTVNVHSHPLPKDVTAMVPT